MKIAIFLGSELESGGGFQYELNLVNLLRRLENFDYEFKFFTISNNIFQDFSKTGIEIVLIKTGVFQKIKRQVLRNLFFFFVAKRFKLQLSSMEKVLLKHKIDLVYFLSPCEAALDLVKLNYIVTVWDLMHRDFPEFPEVRDNRQFERRDDFYQKALKKAVAIITESETGKDNLIRRYQLDADRIKVLPFLSSFEINLEKDIATEKKIREKYQIKGDFIFYPAQFWPHKNHIYILEALKILKEKYNMIIFAVFTGSNKGNCDYIKRRVEEFGLFEQIVFPGFVDIEEIPVLYKSALALVMPSYCGPTNIPPLEAFSFGCPVCYSDLPGLRDQVGDAAYLLDLKNPESLAESLLEIKNKPEKVEQKRKLGVEIIKSWSKNDFWQKLEPVFKEFQIIRDCWE